MLIGDIRQRAFAALPTPRLWLSFAYLSSREACATSKPLLVSFVIDVGRAHRTNMNDYSDFEPTYTLRRKDNGRWCVVLIRADGSEREIGDFASDSEAWD